MENVANDFTCQRCAAAVDGELHSCPFAEEIHDNYEATCNCCKDCVFECMCDI